MRLSTFKALDVLRPITNVENRLISSNGPEALDGNRDELRNSTRLQLRPMLLMEPKSMVDPSKGFLSSWP